MMRKLRLKKNGTSLKSDLKESPFVRELDYGINYDGYWTYKSMVLQLVDCIDVLNVTHPHFDFLFIFDHSNGHDRLQPNGLSLSKINILHGGKQPQMRSSELSTEHFGPYHNSSYNLQPGNTQHMQYQSTEEVGPCYMSMEERKQKKYDQTVGVKVRKLNKSELILHLKADGTANPRGNKNHLQKLCEKKGLPINVTEGKVKEGWYLKQKGALQILYERGWIDPHNIQHYTEKGKKNVSEDPTFHVDPTGCNFSIDKLMKQQMDFVNELTLLQYHGNLLGVTVDRSPKCHPEIAGEGIEYLWGLSKMWYRKAPISSERTKDLFRKLVNDATDGSSVLNIERIRSCSKKARAYMKLYKAFRDLSEEDFESIPNKYSIMEGAIKNTADLQN